jgi:hypothetical protein
MASDSTRSAVVADSYARVERIGFGVLMIAAPLVMLAAALLHPPHGIQNAAGYYHASHDHSARFYVAHTCFFLAAVLFVPAVVGLARLVHPGHPKAAFWGCVLSFRVAAPVNAGGPRWTETSRCHVAGDAPGPSGYRRPGQ